MSTRRRFLCHWNFPSLPCVKIERLLDNTVNTVIDYKETAATLLQLGTDIIGNTFFGKRSSNKLLSALLVIFAPAPLSVRLHPNLHVCPFAVCGCVYQAHVLMTPTFSENLLPGTSTSHLEDDSPHADQSLLTDTLLSEVFVIPILSRSVPFLPITNTHPKRCT